MAKELISLESAQPRAQRPQLFKPGDADYRSWSSPSDSKCSASFGDCGTTATAGAFGQLVQFSDYLGAGSSGTFSAGHSYTKEPYWVTRRARQLHSLASEPFEEAQRQDYDNVFGLKFLNMALLDDARPKLEWLQYQWPRFEYKRRCFKRMKSVKLTIQFIVRHKTVFQQCILENRGKTDVDLELAFCKGMSIRDLDHLTDDYEFNKTTPDDQNAGPGPGGFGWVHVNRFREGSPARTEFQDASHENDSNRVHRNRYGKNQPNHGVALVVSMVVDGKTVRFSPGQSPHIWKQTLKAKSSIPGSKSQKLEIVTAYKLVLLTDPLSDWRTFVVPLKEMDLSRLLSEAMAVSSFRTSMPIISGNDGPAHSYDRRQSETLEGEENKDEAGMVNVSQDEDGTVDSKPPTEPSPAIHHEPTPEKTLPVMEHIEFSARRNLAHILDVCAIPVAVSASGENIEGLIWDKLRDVQPIALSCGDLSGHRICTTSSLYVLSPRHTLLRYTSYLHEILTKIAQFCVSVLSRGCQAS